MMHPADHNGFDSDRPITSQLTLLSGWIVMAGSVGLQRSHPAARPAGRAAGAVRLPVWTVPLRECSRSLRPPPSFLRRCIEVLHSLCFRHESNRKRQGVTIG
eukprot:3789962-Rhodomonas_salina.4